MKTYTPEQIRQAGKDGEISSIDVEHLISLLPTEEEGIKEDDLETNCLRKINGGDECKTLCEGCFQMYKKKVGGEPSVQPKDLASLASHTCTIGNSIQK